MKRVLGQGWWAPIGAVLSVCNMAIGEWIIASEQNPGSIVGGSLHILGGIALVTGLAVRPRRRTLGTGLVLAGAFWGLPIIWLIVPPILAVAVIAGVLTSRPASETSPAR